MTLKTVTKEFKKDFCDFDLDVATALKDFPKDTKHCYVFITGREKENEGKRILCESTATISGTMNLLESTLYASCLKDEEFAEIITSVATRISIRKLYDLLTKDKK